MKNKIYTSHICSSSTQSGGEYYLPQVLVKGIILNNSGYYGRNNQEALPVCFLCHPGHRKVKLQRKTRREHIAWLVREVLHANACCQLASPPSPSSPFQQRKIQTGERQNCVRTLAPDGKETAAGVYSRILNNAL